MSNELKFTLVLDGKQYTGTLAAAEEATRQFTETTTQGGKRAGDALREMGGAADAAAAGGRRAGDSLRDMTGQANAAAAASTKAGDALRRMTQVDKLNAARDILNVRSFHDIQREIQQVEAAYKRLADSGKLSAQELAVANQAQQASIQRLKAEMQGIASAMDKTAHAGQVSAGQTAAAWRQLPMQMQDVAVSLQGGMSPFTVLMQQGPQITSAFGGVKETLVALRSAITPLMIGVAALAGAGLLVASAYMAGAGELRTFDQTLIMTGGRIGLTSDSLSDMSRNMGQMAGITQGQAAGALNMLAGQAGITSTNIERIASAALRLQAVGGPAVEETARAFTSLAQSPLQASVRLNEQTGFLTESVYKQVRALEAQGRTVEAAKVAQEAYATAIEQRIPALEANLGSLEKAWKSLTSMARGAWDAMLNVGREDTLDQKLAAVQKKIVEQRAFVAAGGRKGWAGESVDGGVEQAQADLQALESEAAALSAQINATTAAAAGKAASAAKVTAQISGDGGAGDKQRAIASADIDLQLAQAKAAADKRIAVESNLAAALEGLHANGLVAEAEYVRRSAMIEGSRLNERRKLIEGQIALEAKRPVKADDIAGASQQQARLVGMRAELAAVRNELAQVPKTTASKLLGIEAADSRALAQEWATSVQSLQQQAEQFASTNARAQAQLITDPLKRARAEAEISAAEIERTTGRTAQAMANQVAILRGNGLQGMADALQAQLASLQAGAAQAAQGARSAPDMKLVDDLLKRDIGSQMADGFDRASQSMSAVMNGFRGMIKVQDEYTQALATQGLTEDQVAKLKRGQTAAQLNSYVTLAGAAKGMFKEHTAGYKVLSAAEKAFRMAEMVGTAQAASAKIALWWASATAKMAAAAAEAGAVVAGQGVETGAVVAGEAARNTAKTPGVFMAFMSALGPFGMAAAGVAIAAVLGSLGGKSAKALTPEQMQSNVLGGGAASAADRQKYGGTGTVLGDQFAKSESIANSLDALADVDKLTMQYSAQMAASLRSIEASMAGVSTQILRAGGINTGKNLGIKTEASGTGDAIGSLLSKIPLIGGVVGGVVGGIISGIFGKSSTSITDAGLSISGTAAQMQQGQGVNQYADATTTKKSWFSKSVSTSTILQDAGADVSRQFGLIFGNVSDSLQAAAGAMGQDAGAVGQQLAGYVIDIPRLSMQGLTGEGLQEAISAAVGAKADEMAKLVAPGLSGFQQVGEGYFETTVRVASATETATETLRRLGLGAVSLSDIVNKQGDVGAELVRQSIARVEVLASGAASSLGSIIGSMDGSAQDLADTYRTLLDVRGVLRTIGLDGEAVTSDLIRGAGSLSALKEGMSSYEEKFLTAAEQTALKTGRMAAEFNRLGLSLPENAASFRKLVEGTDTATAAGQAQLGGLLALSSAFSEFLVDTAAATEAVKSAADIASERAGLEERLLTAQGDTAALRARELAKLDGSNRALQERIWALEDEKKASEALASAGKGVAAYIDELRGVTGGTASTSKRRATYQADLTAAQAGDAEASTRVVTSAKALVDSVKAGASDPLAVARETSRIAAQLSALPAALAYAGQQTAATATTAAAPSISAAGVPAPMPVMPVQAQAAGISSDPVRAVLDAVLRELSALRAEQASAGASIAASTGKTARILEGVTPDGDAMATRTTR